MTRTDRSPKRLRKKRWERTNRLRGVKRAAVRANYKQRLKDDCEFRARVFVTWAEVDAAAAERKRSEKPARKSKALAKAALAASVGAVLAAATGPSRGMSPPRKR